MNNAEVKAIVKIYRQLVLDVFHAGGRPGRIFDRKFLIPVANLAFEQDFIIVADGDAICPWLRFRRGASGPLRSSS